MSGRELELDATTNAYYVSLGDDAYRPTLRAQGAWQHYEQHMGAVAGLLAHVIETHEPRPDLQLARLTYEIFGVIHAADSTVQVRTIRPGRTIELVEATLEADGAVVVRATAWRLARQDTSPVAAAADRRLPAPGSLPPGDGTPLWAGGYYAAQEVRRVPGGQPGSGQAWVRSATPLIDGMTVSPLASFVTQVDTANGLFTLAHPDEWAYPNVDLSIHLFREPTGEWVGFDTEVTLGASGVGLTSSLLHDELGPVGRAEQILTIRKVTHERPRVAVAPNG